MINNQDTNLSIATFFSVKFENANTLISCENIVDDQYLCPSGNCHNVPEIKGIDFKKNTLELSCKEHGQIRTNFDKYIKEQIPNTYINIECQKCSIIKTYQKYWEKIFFYCYECNLVLCPNCKANCISHPVFPINEIGNRCKKHKGKEFKTFCLNDKMHLCEQCEKEELKDHKSKRHILAPVKDDLDEKSKEKIENILTRLKSKRNELANLLKNINDRILMIEIARNAYKKHQKNYNHISNYGLICSLLEGEENNINELINPSVKNVSLFQLKLIEDFNKKFNFDLDPGKEYIDLYRKVMKQDGFANFVKISFPRLVNLYLGRNEIENLKPLDGASYPELKLLSFSHNILTDVEGIDKLDAPNLQYLTFHINEINIIDGLMPATFDNLLNLDLSNNHIADISPLIQCNFKSLETINLESNEIEYIEPIRNFNFPDLIQLKLNKNKISSINILLQAKFPKLKVLELSNNCLTDISAIKQFKFCNLEVLNLSCNQIVDVSYLVKTPMTVLRELYLHENLIQILPIPNNAYPELKKLTLKGNNLKFDDEETKKRHDGFIERSTRQNFVYDLGNINIPK